MANTTQIVRLTCAHDYFSGAVEDLRLQPTEATIRWAKNHRMLMHNLSTDIRLYRTPETPEDYKELLTFWLLVKDAQFYNYTVLPGVSIKNKLFYLSNKDGRLSAETQPEETDFLDKIYGVAIDKANIGEEKMLSIKDQAGNVIMEISWDGSSSLVPYINDLPPGKYDWTYGDTDQGFFFGDSGATAKVFGLLEIDLNALEDTGLNIRFNVRESIWEYYIIDKKEMGNSYEIIDERSEYQFGTSEQITVLGGRAAVRIASEAPIPFKQYPDYEFKLVTNVNSGAMKQPWNASMMLPAASSEQLQVSNAQQTEYITPIYIYI